MAATVRPETVEAGDIGLPDRPRVDPPEVRDRAGVQRHFIVLAAKWPARSYRMLVVGRKQLPTLTIGQDPERRNWALTVRVSRDPDASSPRSSTTPSRATGGSYPPQNP